MWTGGNKSGVITYIMTSNSIQNLERFRNCYCNKDDRDNIVELVEFPQDKVDTIHVFRQEILFMIQGNAHISMEGLGVDRRLKKGEFVFLPAGSRVECDVQRGSIILLVRIASETPDCPVFRINKTGGRVARYKEPTSIHALKLNKRLRSFVTELMETRSIECVFITDVSGQPIGPIFKNQAVQVVSKRR